jgi:hypothetical protein
MVLGVPNITPNFSHLLGEITGLSIARIYCNKRVQTKVCPGKMYRDPEEAWYKPPVVLPQSSPTHKTCFNSSRSSTVVHICHPNYRGGGKQEEHFQAAHTKTQCRVQR